MSATYANSKFDVTVDANSKDKVTNVGAATTLDLSGNKVKVNAGYDLLSKVIKGKASVAIDDATATVSYCTEKKDAILEVAKPIDADNTIIPSISQSGAIKVGWLRKWTGGSVKTTFYPDDKVELEWKDQGVNGVWTTTAEVPLKNHQASKVSFSRDWNY